MTRAVFLDRDGVLIRTFVRQGVPHPPQTLDQVEVLPGVAHALHMLRVEGFELVVVTNQPDVARGTQTRGAVEAINAELGRQLPLDEICVCYHDTADRCACRKPAPGMLLAAAQRRGIDLASSFMVGDRGSDIAAGTAAGCASFLIQTPYSKCDKVKPHALATDLADVARQILSFPRLPEQRSQESSCPACLPFESRFSPMAPTFRA